VAEDLQDGSQEKDERAMLRIVRTVSLVAALVTHCAPPRTSNAPELTVPAIGLSHLVIVVGGQEQIDGGNVVNFGHDSDGGCWPGQGCTVWLAGHRTSHGGVFRKVPQLKAGDQLTLRHDGATFTYVVTDSSLVDRLDPPQDFMHGDLMIQTSWTLGRVLLVYADQASI
jgi:LPXTG-site transpeptidase (sortase) family protein